MSMGVAQGLCSGGKWMTRAKESVGASMGVKGIAVEVRGVTFKG